MVNVVILIIHLTLNMYKHIASNESREPNKGILFLLNNHFNIRHPVLKFPTDFSYPSNFLDLKIYWIVCI